MKLKTLLVGSLSVLLLAALTSTAAQAAIIDITYTGTVTNGTDTTGVFVTPPINPTGDLDGYSIGIVFRFDTSQGTTSSSPNSSRLDGGGSVVVTINNHSVTIVDSLANAPNAGNDPQFLYNTCNSSFSQCFTEAHVASDFFDDSTFVSEYINLQVFDDSGTIPISILQPYSLNISEGQGTGNFNYENHQPFQSNQFDHQDLANVSSFTLNGLTVSESEGSVPVPEPASLALLLTALVGFGEIRWRRHRTF